MSDQIIRKLIETRVSAFADSQSLATDFENVAFTKDAEDLYLRFRLLPANTESPDVQGMLTAYAGIAQIDLCARQGGGLAEVLRIADLLRAQFPTNLRLTQDTFAVQQLTPLSVQQGFVSGTRFIVPTWFRYRGD